uniref:Acyl-coenzyme A oxidase n=1 Tax=Amphimedon queenslandica TaxID=400682 RepID=A0AAN0JCZ4_AMPQE
MSTEESFDSAVRKNVHYIELLKSGKLKESNAKAYFKSAIDDNFPTGVHELMFVPTIEGQGNEEQKKKWLKISRNFDIIGCYAQTELGHGTFIRGLETIATYDPSTEEFVMNSPTLTSMKWWPGSVGHTATHAIVVARLITKGKDEGIHLFIVQIRSLEDHNPLPGIKVGDIGPKFGYFGTDNGFLHMTNVRIPRDHMLMKYAQVSRDGTYSKPPAEADKISYAVMVYVRALIVDHSAETLARAITIAIRYSVVRRQTQNRPGEPETQVLDYQTQQFKLFPLLASAYAIKFAGHYMTKLYTEVTEEISEGKLRSLPELHATSAGLKAFCTELCCSGIELCRLSCGGHGYSAASGLPQLYADYSSSQTYEGENTVMLLQTARYIFKVCKQNMPQAQLPSNVAYLAADYPKYKESPVSDPKHFNDPHILLEAYRQRVIRLVAVALERYSKSIATGLDSVAAWNNSSVDWTMAARAHCHYLVLKAFHSSIDAAKVCEANFNIMRVLCCLFGLHGIIQYSGEFCLDGYMNSEQIEMAKNQLYFLLKEVRYEAVPLVDAFDIHDDILNSSLGRYDGDVYRHLYEWALRAPRNKKEVHDNYEKYLKPLLKNTKSKL